MTKPLHLIASAVFLQACASAPSTPLTIPSNLQAEPNEKAAFRHFARGVQIYKCEAQGSTTPTWKFLAPEALLYADSRSDKSLGNHGAGPFWRANDGSKVVGTVKNRADAPATSAIPWLLLGTKAEAMPGQMSSVSSIQRIETVGGVAPATGCSAPGDLGKEARVPYTAVYVYFTKS